MFGYIYLTENLINGRCYIGRHSSPTFDKKYKGSGVAIKKAIKKYGWDSFVCQPIEWCETEEELNKAEEMWIIKCNAIESPLFYNIAEGGAVPKMTGDNNPSKRPEVRKKISDKAKGKKLTEEHRKNISKAKKGVGVGIKNPKKGRPGKLNSRYGDHNYYGKYGPTGKHWYTNGITSVKTTECPEGYWPGRVYEQLLEE